MPKFKTEGF